KTRIQELEFLTRSFHELPAATADNSILPGVLGCRTLRRTIQVRLASTPLRLPGGTPFATLSRRRFIKHPGTKTLRTILQGQIRSLQAKDKWAREVLQG
ncbi:MAG: hypothetical protein KJP05_04925, partial [Deltaproteobacteria bacterium]|nr:hypothetical protein [Deltaproteobacteria bacterium]